MATKTGHRPSTMATSEDLERHGSIVLGKVSSESYKKVIKCGVPKHRYNDHLRMYVREIYNVQALDEDRICKAGDWVLLRRKTDLPDQKVTHQVERIIYSSGNYIDPISNKRSLGLYYDEEMKQLEKIKISI